MLCRGAQQGPQGWSWAPHHTWFQFTVKQVSLSITSPWYPRGAALMPPSHYPPAEHGEWGAAALKHSIKEPAGLSPGQGQS